MILFIGPAFRSEHYENGCSCLATAIAAASIALALLAWLVITLRGV